MSTRNLKICLLLLAVITCIKNKCCHAQNSIAKESAFSIYYLSVGSSDYSLRENEMNVFHSVTGAKRSAKLISELLNDFGAIAGKTIISDPLHPVTREDIFNSLKDLIAEVDTSNNKGKPLVVYYFCGHGLGDNYGWGHFSVPGDFNCQMHSLNQFSNFNSSTSEVELWEEIKRDDYALCISTSDIVDILEQSKLQYLVLLDNCYEGHELRFSNSSVGNLLQDTHNIFAFMNEYHQSYPVVFSSTPGTSVSTSPDPTRESSSISVGPICRRTLLSYNASKLKNDPSTLNRLIKDLRDDKLDSITKTVYCKAENIDSLTLLNTKQQDYKTKGEIINASGGLCIEEMYDSLKNQEQNVVITPIKINDIEGTNTFFKYSSTSGDYLGEGKSGYLNLKNSTFYITEWDSSTIEVTIEGSENWSLSFSAKLNKPLLIRSYSKAQRFNSNDNPGQDISHNSSACNESKGEFKILELNRTDSGKIHSISLNFVHFCDQNIDSLTGNLRINSKLKQD